MWTKAVMQGKCKYAGSGWCAVFSFYSIFNVFGGFGFRMCRLLTNSAAFLTIKDKRIAMKWIVWVLFNKHKHNKQKKSNKCKTNHKTVWVFLFFHVRAPAGIISSISACGNFNVFAASGRIVTKESVFQMCWLSLLLCREVCVWAKEVCVCPGSDPQLADELPDHNPELFLFLLSKLTGEGLMSLCLLHFRFDGNLGFYLGCLLFKGCFHF